MRTRRLGPVAGFLRHAVLMAGAVVMIAPFVWMVLTSLKPQAEIIITEFRLFPEKWAVVHNYTQAFTRVPMLRFLLNGVLVTVAIFVLQILVNLPCAYALAKLRFRGRAFLFAVVLLGLLIPLHATAIPIFILFHL
ncbi:MAG: carbohydrate ABC transporter permease, partial [Alphaproteobacteria bacterium]|nr:carbohydrate ABC transporter permease [Alphaproteobacteria bacterium]